MNFLKKETIVFLRSMWIAGVQAREAFCSSVFKMVHKKTWLKLMICDWNGGNLRMPHKFVIVTSGRSQRGIDFANVWNSLKKSPQKGKQLEFDYTAVRAKQEPLVQVSFSLKHFCKYPKLNDQTNQS